MISLLRATQLPVLPGQHFKLIQGHPYVWECSRIDKEYFYYYNLIHGRKEEEFSLPWSEFQIRFKVVDRDETIALRDDE